MNNDNDDDDDDGDIISFNQVATAADCAKQCADEPQCHGWGHFAPAKRYNDGDDQIMMMKLGCG